MKTVRAAATDMCRCAEPSENGALRRLLDASPDVICTFDAGGCFLYVSAAAAQVWGYAPKELVNKCYLPGCSYYRARG